ncbi:MAG: WG repeat-containing protein [Flavobacteriales bacterium]|jgi:hypothetical protein|nr:WG repeat-containing protein [Flavobacteriales bacterium]
MKNYITIILFLCSSQIFGQNNELFRIVENGKIGYINVKGETIIHPKYIEASVFSEGLASFRINGQYGFINSKDEIILPAIYDFVGSFRNGIVDVYNDNEVRFINKKGERVLPKDFKSIRFIDKNNCVFTTTKGKSGIYNFTNSSIIFQSKNYHIGDFSNGLAVVTKNRNKNPKYGVIDKKGNFIVKFGKYSNIKKFKNGYATVDIDDKKNKDEVIDGVINTNGDLLFKRPHENNSYLDKDFHNGFSIVKLYKYWIPEKNGVLSSEKSYQGFVNLNGEVVFNDTLIKYVYDFSDNRAFIEDHDRNYYVVDTNFNILNEKPFENVKDNGFRNGYAIVESDKGWGIIDVNMNYVVKPEFEYIHGLGINDNLFFFGIEESDYSRLYGIKNLKGKTICPPIIEDLNAKGFQNGLLKVVINKKLAYLNLNGDIVWQKKQSNSKKSNHVNITHLNRGYFYAYSKVTDAENNSGGWAVSHNEPAPLKSNQKNKLAVIVEDLKLYIRNYSKDTIEFNAQDSRLYMKLQAKNKNGVWKDIEYLPSSWCGNSYHRIELPPNNYWQFDLPKYEGDFKTLFRAELMYINPTTKKEKVIYSNEFDGHVNPGQFWRMPEYTPRGIMDPYYD